MWRYGRPSRDHRCGALEPPTVLASDKQRRLCLAPAHVGCPTFVAARRLARAAGDETVAEADAAAGGSEPAAPGVTRWHLARTAPLVIDGVGRRSAVAARRGRGLMQLALAVLLVGAFAAVAVSRLGQQGAAVVPSPSASASIAPTADPTPEPTPTPSAPPAPTASPTAAPTPAPTPDVTPTAGPTEGATYVVRSGDTLSGIAARFGTTVQVLQDLNGIANPSLIRPGQVLQLP